MNDKSKKLSRLKARLPRGLEDRGPAAMSTSLGMAARTVKYLVMKYPDYLSQESLHASQWFMPPLDRAGVANGG